MDEEIGLVNAVWAEKFAIPLKAKPVFLVYTKHTS